jgi:hypothetical protein
MENWKTDAKIFCRSHCCGVVEVAKGHKGSALYKAQHHRFLYKLFIELYC